MIITRLSLIGLSLDTGKLSYLTINADPGSMYMCLYGSNVRENDENVVQKYALESGDLFPFAERRASTHPPSKKYRDTL